MATENSSENNRFHTVIIRGDLPKVRTPNRYKNLESLPKDDYWIYKLVTFLRELDSENDPKEENLKVEHNISNGPHTKYYHQHALYTAFVTAYNSHEDIVLSPDDLWLMITIYYAKYVNVNAEKLRYMFVNHQGKINLTIEQCHPVPDWDAFLENMRTKIGENVKNDIVTNLTSNFSTSGKVEYLLSCATTMNCFKAYFDYTMMMCSCGIRKVHFLGNLEDWLLLKKKIENLRSYTTPNDSFETYITGILPIIDQFIRTYRGQVDNQFWDTIFDFQHSRAGSGTSTTVSGWFLKLCFGVHHKRQCDPSDISLDSIITPIQFEDKYRRIKKTCYVVGGFHGTEDTDGWHKPVMSLAIISDESTIQAY